jgi:hypothetical protein
MGKFHVPKDKLIAWSGMMVCALASVVVPKPWAFGFIGLAVGIVIGAHLRKDAARSLKQVDQSNTPPGTAKSPDSEPNLRPQVPELSSIALEGDIWTKNPSTNRAIANRGKAILIPIRNEPKQQGRIVGTAKNIKARLTWYLDGKETREAFPAAWLEEWLNYVEIGAEAKRIVVAFEPGRDDWQVVTNSRNDGNFPGVPSMHFDTAVRVPRDGKGKMELQILKIKRDAIETLATYVYDWRWEDGQVPHLSLRAS